MKAICAMIVAGAVCLCAVPHAFAGDGNPPPWRGLPRSTVQGWHFVNGGPLGTDPTIPHHNPYGTPQFQPGPGTSYAPFPVPDPDHPGRVSFAWSIAPGGFLEFLIPNHFDPTTPKEIWVQIKYWGSTPGIEGAAFDQFGQPISHGYTPAGGPVFSPGPGTIPGTHELTLRMQFDVNPAYEIIRIVNTGTQPLYVYQVVIDTICPTPGTAAAGLIGLGVIAGRRRR